MRKLEEFLTHENQEVRQILSSAKKDPRAWEEMKEVFNNLQRCLGPNLDFAGILTDMDILDRALNRFDGDICTMTVRRLFKLYLKNKRSFHYDWEHSNARNKLWRKNYNFRKNLIKMMILPEFPLEIINDLLLHQVEIDDAKSIAITLLHRTGRAEYDI